EFLFIHLLLFVLKTNFETISFLKNLLFNYNFQPPQGVFHGQYQRNNSGSYKINFADCSCHYCLAVYSHLAANGNIYPVFDWRYFCGTWTYPLFIGGKCWTAPCWG